MWAEFCVQTFNKHKTDEGNETGKLYSVEELTKNTTLVDMVTTLKRYKE